MKTKFIGRLPVRDGVTVITYHRKPTMSEIKWGYGATHYRDFEVHEFMRNRYTSEFLSSFKSWGEK